MRSANSSRVRRLMSLSGINEFFCGVSEAISGRGIWRNAGGTLAVIRIAGEIEAN